MLRPEATESTAGLVNLRQCRKPVESCNEAEFELKWLSAEAY